MVKPSTSARSPLSPTLWPPDAFVWWQSLLVVIAILIVSVGSAGIFAAFAVAFGATTVAQLRGGSSLSAVQFWDQMFSYVVTLALLAAALPAIARRTPSALGLRAPRVRDIVWGIGGAVVMVVAAILTGAAQDAIFHLKPDEVQVQWLRATHGAMIAAFAFLACIAAPVFEETVFRGLIFNAVLRYAPSWAAVIVSAAVFGFAHAQPGNAGAIAPLAMGGIVLAVVYYRTGSLAASMITHGSFNFFTVFVVTVLHQT